nr:MAG: ORF2 [Torque teno polar bear virus 5]
MLMFHRRALLDYKRKEAIWKQSISRSHSLFCNCGDYLKHFQKCHLEGDGGRGGVSPGEGISFTTEDGDGIQGGEDIAGAAEEAAW